MSCPICSVNTSSDEGSDPWLVARLQTGYVRLGPNQYFREGSFFVSKECVKEVFHLEPIVRALHLEEMAQVAGAVNDAFQPSTVNVESFSNGVPHLHWWITPRYETDPRPQAPIWEDLEFLRALWTDTTRPSSDEFITWRALLIDALRSRDVEIELAPER
jgi:diadenosine tetraphosphate (Ap4A) HIT family hydrolase